ncbi:MAG: hypothetical protein IJ418_09125 [Clostridia bacterium]|nr:hypothetical protein [Clostridia bacterium]
MIQTTDDRPLSEIAADFEGCEKIEKVDDGRAGVTEMYEGFTQLTGIRKNAQTGAIHITLARG